MEQELVLWKLFGAKLISFKRMSDGRRIGTGLLNPILGRLSLVTMLVSQARFYTQYDNLARWNGKRVTETGCARKKISYY